jgi:hypothetical protein
MKYITFQNSTAAVTPAEQAALLSFVALGFSALKAALEPLSAVELRALYAADRVWSALPAALAAQYDAITLNQVVLGTIIAKELSSGRV